MQVIDPDWGAVSDHDSAQAAEYRHRLVEELSAPNTIGFGVHFADVQFGRVVDRTWQPLD